MGLPSDQPFSAAFALIRTFSSYKVPWYSSVKCCIINAIEESTENKKTASPVSTTFLKANPWDWFLQSSMGCARWEAQITWDPRYLSCCIQYWQPSWGQSGGVSECVPSMQKSLEVWDVKEITTSCRPMPGKGCCMSFSSCRKPISTARSGSVQRHLCAFGTSHQQYLRVPGPHCRWKMHIVFQSKGAFKQVWRRKARPFVKICSEFVAGAWFKALSISKCRQCLCCCFPTISAGWPCFSLPPQPLLPCSPGQVPPAGAPV